MNSSNSKHNLNKTKDEKFGAKKSIQQANTKDLSKSLNPHAKKDTTLKSSRPTSSLNQSLGGRPVSSQGKAPAARNQSSSKQLGVKTGQQTLTSTDGTIQSPQIKKVDPDADFGQIEQSPNKQIQNSAPQAKTTAVSESPMPSTASSLLKQPTSVSEKGNVKVYCRFRPLNQRELSTTENTLCVTFKNELTCAVMGVNQKTGNSEPIDWTYDRTFDPNCTQSDVYETAVMPVIEQVLEGFNGTIMAYGQTSSGKTHTMLGPDIDDEVNKGVIPRMVQGIFNKIETAPEEIEFTVKVSMIEIYNEKIRDLLDPKKNNLKVHENKEKGVYVKDMTESYVGGEDEVFSLLKVGNENRSIGATDMNKESSRSHSCFVLQIEQKNTVDFSSKCGKIYLVDLAGSERINKTGAAGSTLTEAKNINKSLTALGLVINALTEGATHIPYRDSKLTRILQESLGGNSKTSLIITASPSIFNEAETISTLRFGQRAKQIKNKAKVNKEFSIQELKYMLQMAEKEIIIKNKKIEALETYIEEFQKTGNCDTGELDRVKARLAEETKKIEKSFSLTIDEESKLDTDTILDSESKMGESEPEDSDVSDEEIQLADANIVPNSVDTVPEHFKASILSAEALMEPQVLDPNLKIEEEIQMRRQNSPMLSPMKDIQNSPENSTMPEHSLSLAIVADEEEIQSVHEEELIDQNGEFIIFADEKKDIAQLSTKNGPSQAIILPGDQPQPSTAEGELEANFSKLNYVNKINILLKALMIERNKNSEIGIKNSVLKREYINKVKIISSTQEENEQLIEKVAQGEIITEQRDDEINLLKKKHMEDKFRIEQLYDKNKSLEEVLQKSEINKVDDVKAMETRIETRVQKIIQQKQEIMKQEKKLILQKYSQYEKKIKDQRQQLKEAHDIIQKQKQIGLEERGDSFQNTLNKLINSEKNLDQLKLMYHTLASSKEVMKKENVVLEKKYKRSQQKIKSYDNELKQTRQQVSTFKLKFKSLTEFIKKKGGLEMLNSMPNAPGYQSSNSNSANIGTQQKDLDSIFEQKNEDQGQPQDNLSINEGSRKVTIRGKAPRMTPRVGADVPVVPTIRGGNRAQPQVPGSNSVKGMPPSN